MASADGVAVLLKLRDKPCDLLVQLACAVHLSEPLQVADLPGWLCRHNGGQSVDQQMLNVARKHMDSVR